MPARFGLYLCSRHEVQIEDSRGKDPLMVVLMRCMDLLHRTEQAAKARQMADLRHYPGGQHGNGSG